MGANEFQTDVKLRTMKCELNSLTRSDSSVFFAQGGTCVVAASLGPIEPRLQNVSNDNAFVDCIYRPKVGVSTIKHKLREGLIKDTMSAALLTNMLPRSMFSIQVQELDDDCGMDACSINAACLTLLLNGAPLKFTFAAVHCILDKDQKLILDPDLSQNIDRLASFTFVFDNVDKNIVTVYGTGIYSIAQFNDAELLCRAASSEVLSYFRDVLTPIYNFIYKANFEIVQDHKDNSVEEVKAENLQNVASV